MESHEIYELVVDAVRAALQEEQGGSSIRMARRMVEGTVTFTDTQGRTVKEVPAELFFKKVTSVREKLRVLEQKINNHGHLSTSDRAELQAYLTRCYGSLTTFNFLFLHDQDRFRGTGS